MKKISIVLATILAITSTVNAKPVNKSDPKLQLVRQKAGQIVSSNKQPDNGNAYGIGVTKGEAPNEYNIEYELGVTGEILGCIIRVEVEGQKVIQTSGVMCN